METLVAVYRDRETADTVAVELQTTRGLPEDVLRVGAPADARASIEAEMDAEVQHGWGSGAFGLVTAEMLRGAVIFGAVGFVIGVVLGLPIGVLLYDSSVPALVRLAIGAMVGGLFGSVVGALLGGGIGMKSGEEALAAERGVPVAVVDAEVDESIEAVLVSFDPIRVDRFVEGRRVTTPAREGPSGARETIAELVANATDPARR
jgi:hypothetical protein